MNIMSSAAMETFRAEQYRSDFPILNQVLHGKYPLAFLDNAASTQRPEVVIEAMSDCYRHYYANVHRGIHQLSERSTDKFEQARRTIARFLNAAAAEEIVITGGCTSAINLVAAAWGSANIKSGDLIVTTEMEHHANLVPWFQLAERSGARVRTVKVTDDYQIDAVDFADALAMGPKIVAFTAISNVLGTINPVAELTAQAHAAGALVLVDAAQAAPHQAVDVQAWDCDFLVFSGHKVMGPTGIGVLYAKKSILEAMPPFMGGGGMIHRVTTTGFEPGDIPTRFEAGTPPIAEAIGLAAAIDYVSNIGLTAIAEHELKLTQAAHAGLSQLEGVSIFGPAPELKGGIVSFTVDKVHAHDVAQMLDSYGVAVRAGHHCAMPLHKRFKLAATSRASFYLYNTLEEVQRFVDAVAETQVKFRRGRS